MPKRPDPAERRHAPRTADRRAELAEAALRTLAERGYARTSLREIAQHSAFSHGVLHYYFRDKEDLILCGMRQYRTRCATRYDRVIADATDADGLLDAFVDAMAGTLRDDGPLHRLWYDLRAQAMFERAFHGDVLAIDDSLQAMIWRVISRHGELGGPSPTWSPSVCYALVDGLFQQHLLRFLGGDAQAPAALARDAREVLGRLLAPPPVARA